MPQKGYKQSEEHRKKISEFHKGKKLTEEHKKKIGLSNKKYPIHTVGFGFWKNKKRLNLRKEKHWNWRGGKSKHPDRDIRKCLEYRLWREAVFKRDNWTCVWCKIRNRKGKRTILQADHIKSFAQYPELRFSIDNGRTLCINCHKKTDTHSKNIHK